jgi:uncharacterized membrane protein
VFVKWLAGALLIDAFIISISIAFPGSEDITYHRFGERQWVTFVSVVKLTMIATLSLSCFTVWVKGKHSQVRNMWVFLSLCFMFLAFDEWFFIRERLCGLTSNPGLFDKASAVLYLAVGVVIFMAFTKYLRQYQISFALIITGGLFFILKIGIGLLDANLGLTAAYLLGGTFKLIGESFLIVAFLEALRQVSRSSKYSV